METARISSPLAMMERRTSAAVESAVDAYASRVLLEASPAEACVDESLGPYVTSLLRCSLSEMTSDGGVSSIPEFDSLLELLEEHCSLSEEAAKKTLTTISTAVRTGIVPEPQHRSFRNANMVAESTYHVDPDTLFSLPGGNIADDDPLAEDEFPPLSETQNRDASTKGNTPLKEDRLIPVDLLGALDDPSSPLASQENDDTKEAEEMIAKPQHDEEFPTLGAATTTPPIPKSKPGNNSTKGKKSSKQEAEDLAAVLFRSSRVRQSSVDSDNVSRSTTSAGSGVPTHQAEAQQFYPSQNNQYFQEQWEMTIEMLLTMNPDLGEEAAAEAALIANADPNVAQYVINQALQAPPICRHMLNDHCYRSDCQFSHDVEGHTCLFWIRGRCGKGPAACRFLHGFSDKAVDGIQEFVAQNSAMASPNATSAPVAISTGNLVTYNMNTAFSAPQHENSPFSSFQPSSSSGFENGSFSMPSSWAAPSSLETAMQATNTAGQDPSIESSFAKIASKGYSSGASFAPVDSFKDTALTQPEKTVRIPQELWNPHINRDAHMFHIPDPMERYEAVSTSVSRPDVIDLHFQSTKGFSVVLANVLPEKLREYGEVWIVTGTGHHVGTKTHQKGGGALESAVLSWLSNEGYDFARGKDRQGHTGAILVNGR